MEKELRFDVHRVNSRTNLIEFMNRYSDKDIAQEIGKNSTAWLDELSIVSKLLTDMPLCGGGGMHVPPTEDPEFQSLGNDAYLYLGEPSQAKGLWIKEESEFEDFKGTLHEWTVYKLGTRARIFTHPDYKDIDANDLLPENFEATAERVKNKNGLGKRPIWKFPIQKGDSQLEIFAKGSDRSVSVLNPLPAYRLSKIAGISGTSSEKEMQNILQLRKLGANVPDVIGHYKSDFEQFLFLQSIQGEQPDKCLPEYKDEIIEQDASMLGSLCLAGQRKDGFRDFDDKIFDGEKLWLIDTDECRDLYYLMAPNWRDVLLNTSDPKELRRFRGHQRHLFKIMLKDSIYDYRDSLLQEPQDKEKYIQAFFKRLDWKEPSQQEIERLSTFEEHYQTMNSYINMMMDTD